MCRKLKHSGSDMYATFTTVIKTKAGEVQQSTSEHGGTHSYLIEERIGFTKVINEVLKGDETMTDIIPINPDNEDVFYAMEDGVILCKLINAIQEGTIDLRAVNTKKNLNVYQVKENLNLALNAAKGIGIRIPGITPNAFIEKKGHLILAVLWQIARQCVVK
jgi:plastin-1